MEITRAFATIGRPMQCTDEVALSHLRGLAAADTILVQIGRRAFGGDAAAIRTLADGGLCVIGSLEAGDQFGFPGYQDVYSYSYDGKHRGALANGTVHEFDGRTVAKRIG